MLVEDIISMQGQCLYMDNWDDKIEIISLQLDQRLMAQYASPIEMGFTRILLSGVDFHYSKSAIAMLFGTLTNQGLFRA
ncbi:MAG: hypothetical protein LC127_01640 [Chitinophagales bacterium]|nr:hypothetical protein [Chitinophagales bacterium]